MLIFAVLACGTNTSGTPKDVLHDTVLVSMLTDFFIAEGAMIQLEYIQQKEPDSGVPLYQEIFRKHGVSREEFVRSLEYYAGQPARLDRLYDLAIQQLHLEQEKLSQKKEKESAK